MTDESSITHFGPPGNGGVVFAGRDSIRVVKALTLWSALGLAQHGIMPTRGMSRKKLLAFATTYTAKPYPNTLAGLEAARTDVKLWADEMRAAIPEGREE